MPDAGGARRLTETAYKRSFAVPALAKPKRVCETRPFGWQFHILAENSAVPVKEITMRSIGGKISINALYSSEDRGSHRSCLTCALVFGSLGSVLTFDIRSNRYLVRCRRLETCVHDPISKRRAIHFKLTVVWARSFLASFILFGSLLRRARSS